MVENSPLNKEDEKALATELNEVLRKIRESAERLPARSRRQFLSMLEQACWALASVPEADLGQQLEVIRGDTKKVATAITEIGALLHRIRDIPVQ